MLRDWISRRSLVKYGGMIVAVQEARRQELDKFLDHRVRTRTIFNGVPVGDYSAMGHLRSAKRAELGLKDGDFLVLGLGRLVEQKRPFRFLETAQEIHRRNAKVKFLWIGDGALATQWEGMDQARRLELHHLVLRLAKRHPSISISW